MADETTPNPEDLRSIKELAAEYGLGESTVWLLVARHKLARYRVAKRPKLTLIDRGAFDRAISTPVQIGGRGAEMGKAAA